MTDKELNKIFYQKQIKDFCRKYSIAKLSLYGSVLNKNYIHGKSDIDILVEFEEGKHPSLFTFAGIEIELSNLIGQKVDLKTKEDLSIYFRDDVVNNAMLVYEPEQKYEA